MRELNQVIRGKELFSSIKGQSRRTGGERIPPNRKLFLTYLIQIEKKQFFASGNLTLYLSKMALTNEKRDYVPLTQEQPISSPQSDKSNCSSFQYQSFGSNSPDFCFQLDLFASHLAMVVFFLSHTSLFPACANQFSWNRVSLILTDIH